MTILEYATSNAIYARQGDIVRFPNEEIDVGDWMLFYKIEKHIKDTTEIIHNTFNATKDSAYNASYSRKKGLNF